MKQVISKISQSTIDRIMESEGQQIRHGRYVYRVVNGEIHRCNVGSVGRTWLDKNGNQCDGWRLVVRA